MYLSENEPRDQKSYTGTICILKLSEMFVKMFGAERMDFYSTVDRNAVELVNNSHLCVHIHPMEHILYLPTRQ